MEMDNVLLSMIGAVSVIGLSLMGLVIYQIYTGKE